MKNILNYINSHPSTALAVCLAILAPVKPIMLTIGFLIFADFCTAIYTSVKLNGWSSINSRKMGSSIGKIFLYNLMVLSVFFMEKYILEETVPITKVAAALIATTELKSISENFMKLYGIDIFKKLKSFFTRAKDS